MLQHEVYDEYRCTVEQEPTIAVPNCQNWPAYQTVKSQCPVLPITTNMDEEYFMLVCKQFLADNSVGRTLSCSKECPSNPEPDEDTEPVETVEPAEFTELTEPPENQRENSRQAS